MEDYPELKIRYQVAYATKSGAKCKTAHCELPPMQKGEFRIGTTGSVRSWFHIDCFFKRVTADRIAAIKGGFIGRENIKPEDLARLDELSKKTLDEFSKKRKAENIEEKDDGRWPKKPKYDYLSNIEPPKLLNDNLVEIVSYFKSHIHILRALALVNKQFYQVVRSIMYKDGAGVAKRVLWNMDDKWMDFIQNFQKLSIQESSHMKHHCDVEEDDDYNRYLKVLTTLSNLSSLTWRASESYKVQITVSTRLTQLSELIFDYLDVSEEELLRFTTLTSLKSLKINGSGNFQQMDRLASFATQLKDLKIGLDCFNLRLFTNLESLDISGCKSRSDFKEMIESLPKLVSLVAYNFASDMSKLTSVRHLTLLKKTNTADKNHDITAFPPNLEYFKCLYENIKCEFPPSIRSVYIGRIENELFWNDMAPNEAMFESVMAAVSKLRCPVTLQYMDIDIFDEKPFAIAATNPNLIIIMEEDRYSEKVLERFTKFATEGPLPSRLEIKFYGWKKAARKKKFGKVLEELSQKITLRVEYEDHGQVWRPYYNDPFAY